MFSIDKPSEISVDKAKLGLGIHNVTAVSCEAKEIKENKVLVYTFSNDEGEYEHIEWEPKPEDSERGEWAGGGVKASGIDHLLMRINLITSAVNPEAEQRFSFNDWEEIREWCVENFKEGPVDIKLTNFYKNRAGFNKYIASISKEGEVYVSYKKKFIGHGLTLDEAELEKIKAIQSASPDSMEMEDMGAIADDDIADII